MYQLWDTSIWHSLSELLSVAHIRCYRFNKLNLLFPQSPGPLLAAGPLANSLRDPDDTRDHPAQGLVPSRGEDSFLLDDTGRWHQKDKDSNPGPTT